MKLKTVFELLSLFSLVIIIAGAINPTLNYVVTNSDESSEIIPNAYALKSQGNYLTEINSNKVCGLQLCSEIDAMPSRGFIDDSTESFDEPIVRGGCWACDTFDKGVDWAKEKIDEGSQALSNETKKREQQITQAMQDAAKTQIVSAHDIITNSIMSYSKAQWDELAKAAQQLYDETGTTVQAAEDELEKAQQLVIKLGGELENLEKSAVCTEWAIKECVK